MIGRVVITAPYDKSCSKSHHGICKYVPGTVKTVPYRLFLELWQMICVPPRRDEVIPPYGSSPEKECPPRERPGEGTRPYGYIPESAINNPSLNVTVKPRIECAAERPPRISRVPEGQRGRPEGQGESQEGV